MKWYEVRVDRENAVELITQTDRATPGERVHGAWPFADCIWESSNQYRVLALDEMDAYRKIIARISPTPTT